MTLHSNQDPGQERFAVGQPAPRGEDPKLLRGEGRYTDDVSLPEQVYAVMVRSRQAHGVLRGVDRDDVRQQCVGRLDAPSAGSGHRDGAEQVGVEHAVVHTQVDHHTTVRSVVGVHRMEAVRHRHIDPHDVVG